MAFRIFIGYFLKYNWLVRQVLIALLALVIIGALIVALIEGIGIGNSLYLSFITAFTIGYGDIAPVTFAGRVSSIILGLVGIMFTGLVVAISISALANTIEEENKIKHK